MSGFRAIQKASGIRDAVLRQILMALKEDVEIGYRKTGNILDSFVQVRDLVNLGLLGVSGNTLYDPNAEGAPGFTIGRTIGVGAGVQDAVLTFDATSGASTGDYNLGLVLPTDSYIVKAWYEVDTDFTSGTSSATIAFGVDTDDADGILTAAGLASFAAGLYDGTPDGAVANFTAKTTAARDVIATVGVEALTNGKLDLYVRYITI